MTAAIFGLLGVLLGGLITAGSNYALAVRRERADRKRDDDAHAVDVKRAARLIELELAVAAAVVRAITETGIVREQLVSAGAWQKWGRVVTPLLSTAEWQVVSTAIIAMEGIDWFISQTAGQVRTGDHVGEAVVSSERAASLTPQLEAVRSAREVVL